MVGPRRRHALPEDRRLVHEGRRGVVDAGRLANGARTARAAFDNLSAWPESAQPGVMTTYDPVTLDATAVTDPNGHTTRYLRDGLRRVVQTIDGAGRVTAQRDHDFSRTTSGTSVCNSAHPNCRTDIAYLSRDGHKDLSEGRAPNPGARHRPHGGYHPRRGRQPGDHWSLRRRSRRDR